MELLSRHANSGYGEKSDGLADNIYERTKVFYPIRNSESFNYKTKLVGNLPDDNNAEIQDIKIILPLKNLSGFIFNLDL